MALIPVYRAIASIQNKITAYIFLNVGRNVNIIYFSVSTRDLYCNSSMIRNNDFCDKSAPAIQIQI